MKNTMTPAALQQRRNASKIAAQKKRLQEKCKRGHNNWYIEKNGRRHCRTCNSDRWWYYSRGLKYI